MKKLMLGAMLVLAGCQSTYYSAMESVGFHKRDILVDRIEEVQESQEDVKEQFSSALDRFTIELDFDGGDLEKIYKIVNTEYEKSRERADELSERIDDVDSVANALFREWDKELDEYSNTALRRDSEAQLKETQQQYSQMITAMRSTESKMQPVLSTLKDQSLYLKHNLNARAIASLKTEFGGLREDINQLIRDVETSIEEAERFMAALQN